MYIQKSLWQDAVAQTFNQTDQRLLEKSGLLMALNLIFSSSEVSGLGSGGGAWRLLDFLTDIQLIGNGSRVIQALKAREHQYRGYLGQGKVAGDSWRNYASNTQWCQVPILLGRKMTDVEYALDLNAWDSVQLNVANTATSSSFSTNIAMTALAYYLRDVPGGSVKGYLKAEALKEYAPAAGNTEQTNLPTEGRLRELLLSLIPGVDSNNIENTSFQNLADLIKLDLKSRSVPVWEDSAFRLAFDNWYTLPGEVLTQGTIYNVTGKGVDIGIGRVIGWSAVAGTKTGAITASVPTIDGDRQSFTQVPYYAIADVPLQGMFRGMGYQNILSLPVAWGDTPDFWLDLAGNKQVTLDVRTRSGVTVTSAKNRILIERPARGVDQLV